ncbi:WxL protein peptidoglycan domain-containing protein [Streptomyces sp. H39-C1]|uniref:WxL protein peptidoglycan domain-containing protein n=1 Tax=Streptomyces sp. H39-C1 TaxID=3004355 RepID=UPI0022AE9DAC|nr:DUF916 domain-containing protein [Streptomyces sp. H39-C1]MCZ4100140.1 DUF916 domain-containing protein [Streptomyces sp. H39-C1]
MSRAKACAVLLTVAALLGIGLGPAAGPAGAADNGRWSVFPAPAGGAKDKTSTSQERQFFTLEAGPGTTVKDKVSVSNLSDAPMQFRIYGADAYNTPRDGGFAVRGPEETNKDIGTWVKLAQGSLTVPPRTRADIPFTLTIPDTATPGDHPGAIVALNTETDKSKGSVAVGVRRAVGARIYLRVSGPSLPALSVENVRVDHGQPWLPGTGRSNATIHYTLVNRGNVSLLPRLRVKATGLFGNTLLDRRAKGLPLELLPGQQVELAEKWAGSPQFDRVSVQLTVTTDRGELNETAGVSFFAVPWLAAGVLLAGLALLAAWFVVRRRRNRPPRPVEEDPDPDAGTAGTAVGVTSVGSRGGQA